MIYFPPLKYPPRPIARILEHRHYHFTYTINSLMSFWALSRSRHSELPHVLKPKVHEFYDHRNPNTLWWKVTTQRLKLKRVVRSHCARRLRRIFQEALFLRGFDKNGNPLPQDKLAAGLFPQQILLRGTLEIIPLESILTQDDAEIQKSMRNGLDGILRVMNRWPIDERTGTYQKLRHECGDYIDHFRKPHSG